MRATFPVFGGISGSTRTTWKGALPPESCRARNRGVLFDVRGIADIVLADESRLVPGLLGIRRRKRRPGLRRLERQRPLRIVRRRDVDVLRRSDFVERRRDVGIERHDVIERNDVFEWNDFVERNDDVE